MVETDGSKNDYENAERFCDKIFRIDASVWQAND